MSFGTVILLPRILSVLIGYLFGLIQTSFLYGKLHGTDIRTLGSGNAGTTNALRSFGLRVGLFVAAVDIAKCVAAILICRALFAGGSRPMALLVGLYAGIGCVIGHNFPVYMKFHGGKGVACSAAAALLFHWPLMLLGTGVFVFCVAVTHYVSLGSMLGIAAFVTGVLICGVLGWYGFSGGQYAEAAVLLLLILALVLIQHRSNLRSLAAGSERKTYLFKKKEQS